MGRALGRLPQLRARRLPERGRARLRASRNAGRASRPPPNRAPSSRCRRSAGPRSPLKSKPAPGSRPGHRSATATSGGPVTSCENLDFELESEGLLSVTKASSASGFVFRFYNENEAFANPRERTQALVKRLLVELPKGVTPQPVGGRRARRLHPRTARPRDRLQRTRRRAVPTPPRSASSSSGCPTSPTACAARSTSPSPTTPKPRRRARRTPSIRCSPSTWSPSPLTAVC